jgi:ankyrin repeat protein
MKQLANDSAIEQFKEAFWADDSAGVIKALERHPELKAKLNEPLGPFDSPVITCARSRQMLDVLLAAGADINAKSRWWAGGFGLLHSANPELSAYAIERGAVVDVHAAARLSMLDRLRELVEADATLVHARGGDGQTPLHFAASVSVAAYLLDHGALIDARDVDHESTPAQYMLDHRQDVARLLVQRGCTTDILMAAALGDIDLARMHLDANPDCVRARVTAEFFPMSDHRAGGTIYQWTLGFNVSAHQVAKKFAHQHLFDLLMDRSPALVKLLVACWLGDEAAVRSLLRADPKLSSRFSDSDRRQVAEAARNNESVAVRLMLEAGLPVDARGQHEGTPLHWAGFHGNAEMAQIILRFAPPLEAVDADFNATPLGWAIHGSEHGWFRETGNYAATVEALLRAGAKRSEKIEGSEAVQDLLRRWN